MALLWHHEPLLPRYLPKHCVNQLPFHEEILKHLYKINSKHGGGGGGQKGSCVPSHTGMVDGTLPLLWNSRELLGTTEREGPPPCKALVQAVPDSPGSSAEDRTVSACSLPLLTFSSALLSKPPWQKVPKEFRNCDNIYLLQPICFRTRRLQLIGPR